VVELTNDDPDGRFHPSLVWLPVSPAVQQGWVYDGADFVAPIVEPMSAERIQALRQAAYRDESDPLKNEAEYDAMVAGTEVDYSVWMAKVAEIKLRYPMPR